MKMIERMIKIRAGIERLLPARRVVIEQTIRRESDAQLSLFLEQGPDALVWRGMDECAWRLMQKWENEAGGALDEMGLAVVRSQALMELRGEMLQIYYTRQKKLAQQQG